MVVDLFTDFGYPADFINLFENATDDSIMGTISNVRKIHRDKKSIFIKKWLICEKGILFFIKIKKKSEQK